MQTCRKSYPVEGHVARVKTLQPCRFDVLSENAWSLAEAFLHFRVIKAFYLTPG